MSAAHTNLIRDGERRNIEAAEVVPGGLIEGFGDMRYAHTMAFTILALFSLFTVFNARSDEQSAFVGMFSNKWLWGAVLLSRLLQVVVASSVLWLRELSKIVTCATGPRTN